MSTTTNVAKDQSRTELYDGIRFRVPKGHKSTIQAGADREGDSIDGFCNKAVLNRLGLEDWPEISDKESIGFTADDVLTQANDFYRSSCKLLGGAAGRLAESSISPSTTAMVIAAFAIELYLKYLQYLDKGSYPEIHYLAPLFNGMEDRRLEAIISRMGMAYADIQEQIVRHSDLFIKMRYPFEYDRLALPDDFILHLSETLYHECNKDLGES